MTEQIQTGQSANLTSNKTRDLILSIILDLFGYATYALPFFGELGDLLWAPVAGYMMTRLYKGTAGKIGGIFAFIEEIIPFTDFIPSFSLMWVYTYVIKKEK